MNGVVSAYHDFRIGYIIVYVLQLLPCYNPIIAATFARDQQGRNIHKGGVIIACIFNKAAEELYLSPPAVIKQINAIESELGNEMIVPELKTRNTR